MYASDGRGTHRSGLAFARRPEVPRATVAADADGLSNNAGGELCRWTAAVCSEAGQSGAMRSWKRASRVNDRLIDSSQTPWERSQNIIRSPEVRDQIFQKLLNIFRPPGVLPGV